MLRSLSSVAFSSEAASNCSVYNDVIELRRSRRKRHKVASADVYVMNVSRLDSLGRPELSEGQGRFSQGRIKQAKARPYTRKHGAVRALKRESMIEQ